MVKKYNQNKAWEFRTTKLTPEERTHFEGWLENTVDDVVEVLTTVLYEGYKLTVRFDEEHDTWLATLSGTEYTSYNDRCSVTSRHDNFERAVALTCYKHLVVASSKSWRHDDDRDVWG